MSPTPRRLRTRSEERALYARTTGDMMVGGWDPAEGINPSGQPPVWWIGSDSAPDFLTPGEAPSLAVTNRATALVVDPIAQSPLKVVDEAISQPLQGVPLPTPRWLSDPQLCREDRRLADPSNTLPAVLKLGRAAFWSQLLRGALWWGMCGLLFSEDESGQPQAGSLKIVNPLLLSTERADDNSLRWVIGTGPNDEDRVLFDRRGYVQLGPVSYRLLVLRNPASPVDEEGRSLGVFEMSPAAFKLEGSIGRYAASTFKSGVPSGYLKTDVPNMTKDGADALRASWLRHHGGDTRSIAVLSSTVSFTPVSISPVDAALAEVRRLSIADVAFAFSIDPNMLGAGLQNSASYNNVRDYFRQHRDLGIGMWIACLQDLLSGLLPGSQVVRVDTDAFTRPEAAERYAAYADAIAAGWLLPDDVRALEGLPPLPQQPEPEPVVTPSPAPAPVPATEPPPEPETETPPAAVRALRSQPSWRR
jgi:Phage portal protein